MEEFSVQKKNSSLQEFSLSEILYEDKSNFLKLLIAYLRADQL